jgi:hypothetical protein
VVLRAVTKKHLKEAKSSGFLASLPDDQKRPGFLVKAAKAWKNELENAGYKRPKTIRELVI